MSRNDEMALPGSTVPTVLVLGDHLGYAGGVSHGATSYFISTLPALIARGVSLQACFLRQPHEAADALRDRGVTTSFLSASKWDPRVAIRVAELVRRERISLIHAAGMKATLAARIAAGLVRARVLIHSHDLLRLPRTVRCAHRTFARADDSGIGVSVAARQLVIDDYGVRPARARVIHNGIDVQKFGRPDNGARDRLRAELELPEGVCAIAMIARMHPIKGHRAMLHIMARVVARNPDAVVVMAGDGPERRACEALAAKLGLERSVRFLGARDDVPNLLAACEIVVVPSESEGLSLAAVEALAAGRPVVGFAGGGLSDVIEEGKTGFLVPHGDLDAFAARINMLIAHPEMRAAFGERALVAARRFALDTHVDELIDCYRSVTAPIVPDDIREPLGASS